MPYIRIGVDFEPELTAPGAAGVGSMGSPLPPTIRVSSSSVSEAVGICSVMLCSVTVPLLALENDRRRLAIRVHSAVVVANARWAVSAADHRVQLVLGQRAAECQIGRTLLVHRALLLDA